MEEASPPGAESNASLCRKTELQRRLQKKTRRKNRLLARAQIGPMPRVQTV